MSQDNEKYKTLLKLKVEIKLLLIWEHKKLICIFRQNITKARFQLNWRIFIVFCVGFHDYLVIFGGIHEILFLENHMVYSWNLVKKNCNFSVDRLGPRGLRSCLRSARPTSTTALSTVYQVSQVFFLFKKKADIWKHVNFHKCFSRKLHFC